MTKRHSEPSNDPAVSNYAFTRSRSSYHFDTRDTDFRFDNVIGLGRFSGDWSNSLELTIDRSVPRTSYTANDKFNLRYDLDRAGADANISMFNVDLELAPEFQRMVDCFALDRMLARVNVQLTGQVCVCHIDKLDKLNEGIWDGFDQDEQKQIFIMLTDYQQGHFLQMGNRPITHWHAGDFFDFAHRHVPHYTANASFYPRAMIQLTGIATAETHRFLKWARYEKTVPVWVNSYVENPIKQLQQNLARDLVELESTDLVSEPQLEKITDAYQKVYDIISKAVDKSRE